MRWNLHLFLDDRTNEPNNTYQSDTCCRNWMIALGLVIIITAIALVTVMVIIPHIDQKPGKYMLNHSIFISPRSS